MEDRVSEETEPAASEEGQATRAVIEPPDGEWLVDEQGRHYFIRELPKYEGYYRWVDEHHVRIAGGLTYYVEKHDEDTLYARVYRVEARKSRPATAGREPEKQNEETTLSPVTLSASDRLRFEPFDAGLPDRGQWRNGFEIADMNGDGHLDIVHGPPRKGGARPAIFLGDSSGHWRRWMEARFPGEPLDYGDVAVADFNDDGLQDVAFAVHLRGIRVYVARESGAFTPWSGGLEYRLPASGGPADFSSRAIETTDWNQDGLPDLVVLGEGPRFARSQGAPGEFTAGSEGVVVFLNVGDGTWRPIRAEEQRRPGHFGDSLAVADFDGDGRPDFATVTRTPGIRDILGLGKGGDAWRPTEISELREQAYVWEVSAGDFDHDGRSDLVIAYLQRGSGAWFSGVDLLLSRQGGGWARQTLHREAGRKPFSAVGVGDLDDDGHLDIVAFGQDGESWVAMGQPDGNFAREASAGLSGPETGCAGFAVALVDLDNVPGDEIVAGFAGETGGEIIFGEAPSCPGGGALKAWTVLPRRIDGG